MSCCNGNCNQGRACPARVAKAGQRYQGPDPLPPGNYRLLAVPVELKGGAA